MLIKVAYYLGGLIFSDSSSKWAGYLLVLKLLYYFGTIGGLIFSDSCSNWAGFALPGDTSTVPCFFNPI